MESTQVPCLIFVNRDIEYSVQYILKMVLVTVACIDAA